MAFWNFFGRKKPSDSGDEPKDDTKGFGHDALEKNPNLTTFAGVQSSILDTLDKRSVVAGPDLHDAMTGLANYYTSVFSNVLAMPVMSTSWKASLPMRFWLTLQVMKTTGDESM